VTIVPQGSHLETLLEYLRRSRGFDFTGYKRSSLTRRINRRMLAISITSYEDYVDYLEVHPHEFDLLFNTILINLTAFFRDPDTWAYLADEIIPRIVAAKRPRETIRVWDAGCASGEEAYTIAMVLAETLGEKEFRERVKIYATDVDDEALAQARQASYRARQMGAVPPNLVERYFEQVNDRHVFRKELRRSVIFGRHDLLQDAPISRIDLLVCRNTLMYFNSEAQASILTRFNFALNDDGYLFMGKAEMLFAHGNLFVPADMKRRIFRSVERAFPRERLMVPRRAGQRDRDDHQARPVRLRAAALDSSPVAHLIVDLNGALVFANARARELFGVVAADIGRPLHELEIAVRVPQVRLSVEQAAQGQQGSQFRGIEWPLDTGEARALDVAVTPLFDDASALLGISIFGLDITLQRRMQEEAKRLHEELETAYEELQSTSEELETANEELQSTIEELETTNEELQSTNEELETINEELHSTNEELQTVNEEMLQRTDEINLTRAFLESILTGLRVGIIVVDRDLLVKSWNLQAEDLWGLRSEEALDQHFFNLDIGLPVEQVRQPIRVSLAGEARHAELQVTATNRRGRTIECKIVCSPLYGAKREIRGVILVMADVSAGATF
jgi:two-component system, chemotaxis family, CheB/CheR fusion protein